MYMKPLIVGVIAILMFAAIVAAAIILWQKIPGPVASIVKDAMIVDLRAKGLTTIPAEIGEYTNATQLLLDDNKLTGALPAEIRKMSKLEILSAKNNQLTGIPAEIGQLYNLELIDFSNNNIDTYPNELFQLQQPMRLVLTGNPFSSAQKAELQAKLPNATISF